MGNRNFEWYRDLWYDLYLVYDDNELHADNAFHNNGYDTLEKVKSACESFAEAIIGMGISKEELIEIVPKARYVLEAV